MEKCCEPKRGVKAYCPECGKEGKAVQRITVESLLKEPDKIKDEPYWFCKIFECPVVYFSFNGSSVFIKDKIKVRVGIKEKEDPIPLCYCFSWDKRKIYDEIRETGRSTAVSSITQEVKAGNCFCERSNPQGTCCLEHVSKAVKEVSHLFATRNT